MDSYKIKPIISNLSGLADNNNRPKLSMQFQSPGKKHLFFQKNKQLGGSAGNTDSQSSVTMGSSSQESGSKAYQSPIMTQN
jgi:hypothetical protein